MDEKEKAEEMLDDTPKGEEDKEREETRDEKKGPPEFTLDLLREATSGTIKLLQPFRAHSMDVTELPYDFCGLSSEEVLDALDGIGAPGVFTITNKQALALFIATAAKCAPEINGQKNTRLYDERDIKRGLSAPDSVLAIQQAKLFFNASSQAGNRITSKK